MNSHYPDTTRAYITFDKNTDKNTVWSLQCIKKIISSLILMRYRYIVYFKLEQLLAKFFLQKVININHFYVRSNALGSP